MMQTWIFMQHEIGMCAEEMSANPTNENLRKIQLESLLASALVNDLQNATQLPSFATAPVVRVYIGDAYPEWYVMYYKSSAIIVMIII